MTTPKLKFLDTALYALAVGTGMRWIAVAAAVGPSALPLWGLALAVFFVPLAVATAELTSRSESEGGIYAWTRDTLGPFAGFICGWFYWIALMPYFAGILYFLSGLILAALGGDSKNTVLFIAISTAVTGLVTGVQIAGLKYGKWLPNFGTVGAWIVFAVILAMAVLIGARGEGATDFLRSSYLAPMNFDTAILWGTMVFAYSGMEAMGFLRNEIEGGMRTLVRVFAVVGIGSALVYILGTAAFLIVLPKSELTRLGGFPDALRTGLAHIGMGAAAPAVIGLFALSMLGGFTAWFGVGARLPFAAGLDNFLPPLFARRNEKTGAPVPAILLQAGLTLAMVVLSQAGSSVASAYDFMVAMGVLGSTIPYLFMFLAHLKVAQRAPGPGAWIPPGGRRTSMTMAVLGFVSSAVAIACTLVPNASDPHPLGGFLKILAATAMMTVLGLAFYWSRKCAVTVRS